MSLGVLNNISAIYAQNNLSSTQGSLQKTLQQLSSGSQINSGADNAAGLAVADGLAANSTALAQSSKNANDAIGLLQTADGALSQVTTLLNRAVTLATQAANSTLTDSQVSSANQEYQNILTQVNNIGGTTNFNGSSVFTAAAKNFFVSDGTSSGSTTYADTVGVLTSASIGTTQGPAQTSSAAAPSTVALPGGAAAAVPASASTSTLTLAAPGDTISGTLAIGVGAGASHSITVAASTTGTQLAAQINADSTYQAAHVTAAFNTTSGVLTLSGPAAGNSDLVTTGTSLTDAGNTVAPSAATASSAAVPAHGARGGSTTLTLGAATSTVAGTLSLAVGSGGSAVSLTVKAGTTLSELASSINSNTGYQAAGLTASYDSTAGTLTIAAAAGSANTLSTTGTSLTQTTAATVGAGVDFTASSVSTLTANTAKDVLNGLTAAISDVAYQRGSIGANINQLSSAQSVASNEATNLTAAENNIRATDYGTAASNLSKYQVLSQTGISALAQANSVQQEVLKLLQ